MKKVFLTCLFVVVIVSVTALPSFAADVNFVLSKYPSDFLVNDNQNQSFDYIFKDIDGNYKYAVYTFRTDVSNAFANSFSLTPFVCNGFSSGSLSGKYTSDTPYLFPIIHGGPIHVWSGMFFTLRVYDTSGQLLSDGTEYMSQMGYLWDSEIYRIQKGYLDISVNDTHASYSALFDDTSFVILHPNSVIFDAFPSPYEPSFLNPIIDYSYYDYVNDEVASCSIEDDIYINGTLVYSPSSPNLAVKVISNGIGSLVPEYDGNGNITGYTFNVTTESDYSQIFEYRPDYDVPGLEFDYSSDMPNVEFTQNQLSELSVMDGGSALTWFYARINDLGAGNVKILALMTSCLSLGFVTLILNKRV